MIITNSSTPATLLLTKREAEREKKKLNQIETIETIGELFTSSAVKAHQTKTKKIFYTTKESSRWTQIASAIYALIRELFAFISSLFFTPVEEPELPVTSAEDEKQVVEEGLEQLHALKIDPDNLSNKDLEKIEELGIDLPALFDYLDQARSADDEI